MRVLSKLKTLCNRTESPSLMDAAREWHSLGHEARALLGPRGWALFRSYGRLMSGTHSGQYVSALPASYVRALLQQLQAGNQVPVHLMHRHRSGCYESSRLSVTDGRLLMHYPDRTEFAE